MSGIGELYVRPGWQAGLSGRDVAIGMVQTMELLN